MTEAYKAFMSRTIEEYFIAMKTMVDYAVTPADVRIGVNGMIRKGNAGATITAGQALHLLTGTLVPAQADSSANADGFVGVALNGADSGQPINYVASGNYNSGATGAAGDVVVISAAAAGGIAPATDLVSTNAIVVIGVFTDASNIRLVDSGNPVVKA